MNSQFAMYFVLKIDMQNEWSLCVIIISKEKNYFNFIQSEMFDHLLTIDHGGRPMFDIKHNYKKYI